MASRRTKRVEMDLGGKWMRRSVLLIAASLFLLAVYYFGLKNMADLGFGKAVFSGILPLLLWAAYIVVTQFLRWNAPGLYGLMAALYCILLILGSLFSGSFIRIVLSLVWYGAAACIVLLTTGGSLQSRKLCVAMFGIAIPVRIVFGIFSHSLFDWVAEFAVLLGLAAMVCIPMTLKARKSA